MLNKKLEDVGGVEKVTDEVAGRKEAGAASEGAATTTTTAKESDVHDALASAENASFPMGELPQ